jgi:hypothetical protein
MTDVEIVLWTLTALVLLRRTWRRMRHWNAASWQAWWYRRNS